MAADFKICPVCETRNKVKWDFCARCGESLQDVAAGEAPSAAPEEAPPSPGAAASGGWMGMLVTVVVLIAAVVLGASYRAEPERVDPSIFAGLKPADTTPPPAGPEVVATDSRNMAQGSNRLYGGDPAAALGLLAQAVDQNPADAEARLRYAQALWQTGNKPAALEQYRQASRLAPNDGRLHAEVAKALLALGRSADAIPELEAAVAAEPDSPAWLSQLADLYMQSANYTRAAELYGHAADVSKGNARFLKSHGYALERAGNLEAAAQAYAKALANDPRDATSRALVAETLLKAGKNDDAIALVREGIARDASAAALHKTLGSLFERSGRREEAAQAYREYAEAAPKAPDAQAIADRAAMLDSAGS